MTLRDNIRRALRAECHFDFLKVYAPRLTMPVDRRDWLGALCDFIADQPYNLTERDLFARCVKAGFYSPKTSKVDAGSFRLLTMHRYNRSYSRT
jgi:hypothetical protein